jgi:hypothetical protein
MVDPVLRYLAVIVGRVLVWADRASVLDGQVWLVGDSILSGMILPRATELGRTATMVLVRSNLPDLL